MLVEREAIAAAYAVKSQQDGSALLTIGGKIDIQYASVEAAEAARKRLIAAAVQQRQNDRERGLAA